MSGTPSFPFQGETHLATAAALSIEIITIRKKATSSEPDRSRKSCRRGTAPLRAMGLCACVEHADDGLCAGSTKLRLTQAV